MNPLDDVTEGVHVLADALPGLLEACTDPQAADMAELLFTIRAARVALYDLERATESALGKAMVSDQVFTPMLRVERRRTADRKSWDHDAWQRDVRANLLRSEGLLGAHVFDRDGVEMPAGVLSELVAKAQNVHGSAGPKTTALRGLGLDPDEYAERTPGAVKVTVYRMADEGGTDAA